MSPLFCSQIHRLLRRRHPPESPSWSVLFRLQKDDIVPLPGQLRRTVGWQMNTGTPLILKHQLCFASVSFGGLTLPWLFFSLHAFLLPIPPRPPVLKDLFCLMWGEPEPRLQCKGPSKWGWKESRSQCYNIFSVWWEELAAVATKDGLWPIHTRELDPVQGSC